MAVPRKGSQLDAVTAVETGDYFYLIRPSEPLSADRSRKASDATIAEFVRDTIGTALQAGPGLAIDDDDLGDAIVIEAQATTITITTTTTIGGAHLGKTVLSDATGGAFNVSLPATASDDEFVTIRKSDAGANAVTVKSSGGSTLATLASQHDEVGYAWWGGAWVQVGLVTAAGRALMGLASSADLQAIEALTPTNDDILQRKSGAWANRTLTQVKDDLNNAAGKGTRLVKAWADPTGVSHTGNTTKTTLATIAIPALGASDQIEVTAIGTKSGTNAAASIIIDLDGTTFHNAGTGATNVFWKHQLTICNQGSVSSQLGSSSGITASGNSANAPYTGTVDTSSTKNLTICVQHGGAGSDTVTLRAYSVRIIRGE